MPEAGQLAPDFTANTQDGTPLTLSSFRGKKNVVLYFYPKDDTPGCTKEACGFRDEMETLSAKETVVLGVSPDDEKSHRKFIEKFDLNFTLLADTENAISTAYESYGEKTNYGRTYMGVLRKTYLIDKNGRIARIWQKVTPEGHAQEVLDAIAALG